MGARGLFSGLVLALLLANCFVFSFSRMKAMENVRFAFWFFLMPLIVAVWKLWVVQHRVRTSLVVIALSTVVLFRFFYGPFGVVSGFCNAFERSDKPVFIHAVVLTEVDSLRKGYVEGWFSKYSSIPLEVDTNNPPFGNYTEELKYTEACVKAVKLERLIAYTVRVKRYLESRPFNDEANEWWLMLENDAELVYPASFDRTIHCLAAYDKVDFIWLDIRNMLADFSFGHSQINLYTGGAGFLLRRASFPKLIAELRYNAETCALMDMPVSPDAIWGPACKRGSLTCFTHALITEHGFPSTLGYNREGELGEQRAWWTEFLLTSVCCVFIAYF